MKKIIYFGAAGSGKAYCKHTKSLPDFFVDNDKNKWGKRISGIEIKNPAIIKSIELEYIVITSDALKSILPQILSYGVLKENIKIPPKSFLGEHPFKLSGNKIEAARILSELKNRFSNTPIVAVGGTALGFVRDNDFIEWDSDIDLFAPDFSEDFIFKYLQNKGFSPFKENKSIKGEISLITKDKIPFCIDFYDARKKYYQDTYEDYLWEWPTTMFSNCSTIKIHGFKMNIPNPASKYLQAIYGGDWKKPRPDFNYFDYGK